MYAISVCKIPESIVNQLLPCYVKKVMPKRSHEVLAELQKAERAGKQINTIEQLAAAYDAEPWQYTSAVAYLIKIGLLTKLESSPLKNRREVKFKLADRGLSR